MMIKYGANASYAYNAFDTRVSKTVSGTTTSYKRAGANVTDPVLSEVTGSTTTAHTPGISEKRGSNPTQYQHSGIKNADARTGSSQTVEATRQYDAFGNMTGGSGTWTGPFGYAGGFGYQEDSESGLKLLGHRYYDSTTGRFLSKDPASSGRNWYTYCAANPISGTDPLGMWKAVIAVGATNWWEALSIAAAIKAWTQWLKEQGATEIVVITPTEDELVNILSRDDVEGFVLIGHGADSTKEYAGTPLKSGVFDKTTIDRIAVRRSKRMRVGHLYSCHSAGLSMALLGIVECSFTWSTYVGYSSLYGEPDVCVAGPSPNSEADLGKLRKALSKSPPRRVRLPKHKKGGFRNPFGSPSQ